MDCGIQLEGARPPRLGAERAAAAAGGLDVRIVELEAGTFEALDVIDFRTVQVQHTRLVNEDLQVAEFVSFVQQVGSGLKGHRIAEARASTPDYCNPKAGRLGVLHAQDL